MSATNTQAADGTPLAAPPGSAIHAGNVYPSRSWYTVTESHDHESLTEGNVVVMVEDPGLNNWLLRLSDMTLHPLTDRCHQYVHLSPFKSPAPAGSAGLVDGAAERFVEDLHKLSRQQLAEVAAYCIQLMAKPRHTVIPDDHWMLKHQCAERITVCDWREQRRRSKS